MYDHISQFEPLLPAPNKRDALLEKAHQLQRLAHAVQGQAHTSVIEVLAPMLRAMNSYYTNRIEGQHTLPAEIEQALRKDFAADPDTRRRQRLAVAHMATEAWAAEHTVHTDWPKLFDPAVVQVLHQHLFSQLPSADLQGEQGELLVPGAWRTRDVSVGGHVAPHAKSLPLFMNRFAEVYGRTRAGELAVVAVAAAHHRLAWVHPFIDGNGRVARLHSHLLLQGLGLTRGLWSPLRGMARSRARYYELLAQADLHRRNDLDGRGNLSEEGLVKFCDYFLDICIDQARFMSELLDMQTMKARFAACLAFEASRERGRHSHGGAGTAALSVLEWADGAERVQGHDRFVSAHRRPFAGRLVGAPPGRLRHPQGRDPFCRAFARVALLLPRALARGRGRPTLITFRARAADTAR